MESIRHKLLPNPRETANIFSKLFLTWTLPLFVKGYKKELSMDDVYQPLDSDLSEDLGNRLEKNWTKQTNSAKPSLIAAVFRTFWKEYAALTTICAINDIGFRVGQPFILGKLLLYFREDSDVTYENAVLYATGLVLLLAGYAALLNTYLFTALHNAMKVRAGVCSVIYRKALRLSHSAFSQTATGKVVNLLSNDVSRFEYASAHMNSLWTGPTITIIIGVLLWYEIGWAGIIGIFFVFIVVPIQSYTGSISSRLRLQMALRTDERVRFMDEIISGAQVIKMYAWEKPFAQLIAITRKFELNVVRKVSYIRGLFMTFALFTTRMATFATMLSIALLYGSDQLSAARVFVISSYFGILSMSVSQLFVRGVAEILETVVAFRRLQNFLELDEKTVEPIDHIEADEKAKLSNDISISLQNVTARWETPNEETNETANEKEKLTLHSLNAELPEGKLIGIIGAVGSGKSSLLQAILRELPLNNGRININGTISYASQEPWVFAGTIRQNILFGQKYEKQRYEAAVKACALSTDFKQFPNGDRTVIGERGTSLSGGQKARVNLARAVYRQSDIYLLDDPLSAVDSHVGAHIFHKCLGRKGHLARLNTTRVLVTHQIHFLKDADWLIFLQDGQIGAQGTPSDLIDAGIDLVNFNAVEDKARSQDGSEKYERQPSIQSLASSVNESICDDDNVEAKGVQFESSSKGSVKGSLVLAYFKAGASWPVLFAIFASYVIVQFLASFADFWVSVWTRYEETRLIDETDLHHAEPQTSFLGIFELSTETCIYVQGAVVISLLVLGTTRSLTFFNTCTSSSQKLHDGMFNGLISTKMRFFDSNPSGRILNRFSKDIGTIDEALPRVFLDATQIILSMFGAIIVTAVVNPLFLVPIFFMAITFIFIRKAYLKTSRSIKRLEGNAKSPIFTHLAATLNGLSTIRAYNAEAILINEFDTHQDMHSACWFMFISTTSALGFSLDIMGFVFVTCIIYFFMLFDTGVSGDKIGLAITQAMTLSGLLQWGVRHSAEVSNQMMAVERILEYRDLQAEPSPDKSRVLHKDWPANGSIEFQNVFYRYCAEAQPVLRGLSIIINSKEKIGIVGRTGAGKSSLIGAIFRLACVEGNILIDGIDTATISLKKLRSSIAIIPQDPVLFSGTLRRNLDPFDEYNDADVWRALEKVELKEMASNSMGLSYAVLPHGSNFSVGQRQLICLARAILRKNRIIVLDEATANVDPRTDFLIQQTIREKFADCTVLTVAHRLGTIIDSDRILVMDAGQAIEFDEAHTLLQIDGGIFNGMVRSLGMEEFKRFVRVSCQKYSEHRGGEHHPVCI